MTLANTGSNFEIDFLTDGDSVIIQINYTVVAALAGTSIIHHAEIVDATNINNGATAIDQDSPLSLVNDGTISELATDNDIADEFTGSIDNPSDEDDYDPVKILLCKSNICLPINFIRK